MALGFRSIPWKYLRGIMDNRTNELRRKAADLKSSASGWTLARKTPKLCPKVEMTV
jgi:hypothetical protein